MYHSSHPLPRAAHPLVLPSVHPRHTQPSVKARCRRNVRVPCTDVSRHARRTKCRAPPTHRGGNSFAESDRRGRSAAHRKDDEKRRRVGPPTCTTETKMPGATPRVEDTIEIILKAGRGSDTRAGRFGAERSGISHRRIALIPGTGSHGARGWIYACFQAWDTSSTTSRAPAASKPTPRPSASGRPLPPPPSATALDCWRSTIRRPRLK